MGKKKKHFGSGAVRQKKIPLHTYIWMGKVYILCMNLVLANTFFDVLNESGKLSNNNRSE